MYIVPTTIVFPWERINNFLFTCILREKFVVKDPEQITDVYRGITEFMHRNCVNRIIYGNSFTLFEFHGNRLYYTASQNKARFLRKAIFLGFFLSFFNWKNKSPHFGKFYKLTKCLRLFKIQGILIHLASFMYE